MNPELLALVPKLMELFGHAMKFVANATDSDDGVDADDIAKLLVATTSNWNPRVHGIRVLDDPETRYAGARFIAGIAIVASQRKIRKRRAAAREASE